MAERLPEGHIRIKKWGNGACNSKTPNRRSYHALCKALAGNAAKFTPVVWCSDQHGNRGTGNRGAFQGRFDVFAIAEAGTA